MSFNKRAERKGQGGDRSCHGLSWGETATSVPKSQLWPSLSCQGLGSWLLT